GLGGHNEDEALELTKFALAAWSAAKDPAELYPLGEAQAAIKSPALEPAKGDKRAAFLLDRMRNSPKPEERRDAAQLLAELGGLSAAEALEAKRLLMAALASEKDSGDFRAIAEAAAAIAPSTADEAAAWAKAADRLLAALS